MIVDTSALITILRDEPEAMFYARAIEMADARRVSATNFVEAALVGSFNQSEWAVVWA
jgi:ribonuclease VapC